MREIIESTGPITRKPKDSMPKIQPSNATGTDLFFIEEYAPAIESTEKINISREVYNSFPNSTSYGITIFESGCI